MELDEMKQLWQQQNKLLENHMLLSKEVIGSMLSNRSGTLIARMANWEYFNACVCAILIIIYISLWERSMHNATVVTCYFISLLFLVFFVLMSFYNIRRFSRFNIATQPLAIARRELEKFRLFIARERFIFTVIGPFILIPIYVVVNYWVYGFSIFDRPGVYLPRIVIASLVFTIATWITYGKIYFARIEEIKRNISELVQFEHGG